MTAIYTRELKSLYTTMSGYLAAAFLLLFCGVYTMAYGLNYGYPNFEYVMQGMSFALLFAVPVLTMRSMAGERRQGTEQLLYSLPVSSAAITLGKYLAMLSAFALPAAVMALYPLLLSLYGAVSLVTAYSALAGFLLLGAALLAIGLFLSSLTEHQAVAAAMSFAVLLGNYFLASLADLSSTSVWAALGLLLAAALCAWLIVRRLTGRLWPAMLTFAALCALGGGLAAFAPDALTNFLPVLLDKISFFALYDAFIDGVFDVGALVTYLAATAVFLYLTVQSLEKRRWLG